ncbi:MAG TPA: ABC transporter permease subunit [Aggregatilinea sp.]|uniref:sugar ABC transporter permease n=1 Tax=Aggregatilinea sp. TaxID=2806333 RepID=UPI002C0AED6C|nr:ABC transporter permease subunit [Aggregatilinea sp.]HML24247.1 ABC transporter permease subunit [Aggregatilinea sp.]
MSILDTYRQRYVDERPYEAPSALWLRRIRGGLIPIVLVAGVLLMLTQGMNVLYLLGAIWLAILVAYPDHGFLIFYSIITIYPVSRVVTVSLRPTQTLLSSSLAIIPENASLENYTNLFTEQNFTLWIWNSALITIVVSIIGVIVAATSAYAFSRWRFPGRSPALLILLSTQMIPAGMLLIPIFIIVSRLGLQNNLLGLALAYITTAIPLSIWILRGYYDTIPYDLEEAAMVDGANRLEAFYRIVLPLSTPALAVIFLFNFLNAWSEYQVANVILKADEIRTWPLGLNDFVGNFQTQWGLYAAASVLITIPVVALFLYSSKYLISGLTLGSVKG